LIDYDYNPAQSISLLAQAGYANGFATTLWAMPIERDYLPNPMDIALSIQADLQAVGITAAVETYDWGTYLSKINSGEADLFMLGWGGDFGNPDNFFNSGLCDRYLAYGPYDDTLCDHLQSAREEHDFNTQESMYEWASQHVHDTLPLVPIGHSRSPIILRHNVGGFVPAAVWVESFKDVYFAKNVYLPLTIKDLVP
jgi:peptide/nickel transport system substrate-binding protein